MSAALGLWGLIVLPLAGGCAALLAGRGGRARGPMIVSWLTVLATAGWFAGLWVTAATDGWWLRSQVGWIAPLGVDLHLGLDGLSAILVALTLALGAVALAASRTSVHARHGFYHFNLLVTLAGVNGVFLALDLFLFFVFWEVMLVPMYFLIGIWGHERRTFAAIKFFIFTQASSLVMLVAMIAVAFTAPGGVSFDLFALVGVERPPDIQVWLLLGFVLAFAVKLPAVGVHTWLPDAHTQAPTGGSVLLAGILLKTGAYGLLRFAIPLFPDGAQIIAPWMMAIGAIGVVYGAIAAFAQDDFKRLVAYTSVSHMGFVLVGAFALTPLALGGTVMQLVAHGLSTSALFFLAGGLQDRLHTRALPRLGGLWTDAPRLGVAIVFFAVASLGLPGLGNFIAEFTVLVGAFAVEPLWTLVAAAGLIGASIYSLVMAQRSAFGEPSVARQIMDLDTGEWVTLALMAAALIIIGLYPQPVFDLAAPALAAIVVTP